MPDQFIIKFIVYYILCICLSITSLIYTENRNTYGTVFNILTIIVGTIFIILSFFLEYSMIIKILFGLLFVHSILAITDLIKLNYDNSDTANAINISKDSLSLLVFGLFVYIKYYSNTNSINTDSYV